MPRPRQYQRPEDAQRVSIRQIAAATGMSRSKTARWLKKNSWMPYCTPVDASYDANVIELIHALHGRDHRPLTAPGADWLSEYLRGGPPHA